VTKSKQEEMMPRKRTPEHEAAEGQDEQVVSAATRASELWIESQVRIFEEFDEIVRRWLDRRRDALDAARQSFEELQNDKSIGGLMRIQQEWVIGSMNRLAVDISELSSAALNIAQAAASRITEATERAGRDSEQARQELMSVAGSKPGIPAAK
jgi:Phasin protein